VLILTSILLRLGLTALAFGITAWLLEGMELSGGVLGALWVSLLFGVVNAVLGTILRLLTFPLILLTLGLFAILINAVLLGITDWLTSHLSIDEFWWTTIWAAIILAVVTVVLELASGVFIARRQHDVGRAVPT
jgi:putative membrane protein